MPYINPVLPVLAAGLSDSNPGLRRNSAYCCGVLCCEGASAMQPYFLQVRVRSCTCICCHVLCVRALSHTCQLWAGKVP